MLKIFKKYFLDIFRYYSKGAKIDVALQKGAKSRGPTGEQFIPAGLEPSEQDGMKYYNADDIMRRFVVMQNGTLILKNNSQNFAYDVQILNSNLFFSKIDPLPKLTSIEPNGKLELAVEFTQYAVVKSGVEVDNLPGIPADKEGRYLDIQYKNEAGTKFLTKFVVSFTEIQNEYWFK